MSPVLVRSLLTPIKIASEVSHHVCLDLHAHTGILVFILPGIYTSLGSRVRPGNQPKAVA